MSTTSFAIATVLCGLVIYFVVFNLNNIENISDVEWIPRWAKFRDKIIRMEKTETERSSNRDEDSSYNTSDTRTEQDSDDTSNERSRTLEFEFSWRRSFRRMAQIPGIFGKRKERSVEEA